MALLPKLKIGDIAIPIPIVQGGMGVCVSLSNLASAVSNTGALGVIASVGIGEAREEYRKMSYEQRSRLALRDEIELTKKKTKNAFGVNIMTALANYEELVITCVQTDVPVIFSGAGLPLRLAALAKGTKTKIVPIISSGRAADIIIKAWTKRSDRLPDAVVIEGPLAGGHLGYGIDELKDDTTHTLENILKDVRDITKKYKNEIPIIVGGGIFSGKDIAYYLHNGASGVQMATRFIATYECDAAENYKKALLNSKRSDNIIIDSPVKMPGRVIKNKFVEEILSGKKIKFDCKYKCLKTCDPERTNYCIADALVNAYRGNLDHGFVMAGANCYKVKTIVHVSELISELVKEAENYY